MSQKSVQGISQSGDGKRRSSIRRVARGGDDGQTTGPSPDQPSPSPNHRPNRPQRQGSRVARWGMWFAALVLIAFLFFLYTSISSGVTVAVEPRAEIVEASGSYTAVATGADSTELDFDVVTVQTSLPVTIEAGQREYQESSARGKIRIYNRHSGSPLLLVATTRFETESGLIYRIPEAVTVPGMSGGEPGTVVVEVVADQPGAEYNLESTTLTIPGLAGTPEFADFTAQTVGPISGGFVGERPVISDTDAQQARTEMANRLRIELLKEVQAKIPESFLLLDGATFFELGTLEPLETRVDGSATSSSVTMRQTASVRAIIFDRQDLGRLLARRAGGFSLGPDETVVVREAENMTFALTTGTNDGGAADISTINELEFSLSGKPLLVWQVDYTRLIEDLAGQERSDIKDILSQYPGIRAAQVTIRPFWRDSFPADADMIEVVSNLPETVTGGEHSAERGIQTPPNNSTTSSSNAVSATNASSSASATSS